MAKHTHKFVFALFIMASVFLMAGCSNSKEVDFIKKYKIDLATATDVSAQLQEAINALPENGTLYLQDGTYPLATNLVFKSNMTLKLSDNAVLQNQSPEKHPTMAFNHPLKHNKAEGANNITIEGGVWDMNGRLDKDGDPIDLPNLESVNGMGFGYGSNVTIRNVVFRDCYNGHVFQFAAMDQVLVENCRFEGQSFKGSGNKTRELIQIEQGSLKGYPYTLVQDKKPTTNVTIRGCYFGGSEAAPQFMAAIGTHSQQAGDKCSDILIEECTFDNAAYAAIHFMAYDRMTIRNNTFILEETEVAEIFDRYGILADAYGSMIDPKGADGTTELTIEGNQFTVNASGAVGVTVTGNNGSPKKPSDIVIKDNSLASKGGAIGIELYRVENCVLENNTISGFDAAVSAGKSEGEIQADIDVTYTE
jgi:plasmin/fibronectin-binding protein A